MRFLNFKLSIPEKKINTTIELKPGKNIIRTDDLYLKGIIYEIPAMTIYGMGTSLQPAADITGSDSFLAAIEAEHSGKHITFTNKNGVLKKEPPEISGLISCDDFILYSFFNPVKIESGIDPVLKSTGLKRFLINREQDIDKSGKMHRLDEVITEKEKEINTLKKNRELLELKKRKKDKLVKELSSSDREVTRLRRKRESYTVYKNTLNDILDLIHEEARLSSKIVNLKKDIIEIRELSAKRDALENEISERFPQFTRGMIERLPDLDRLQAEFNTIRDINEEMEKFNSTKKQKISLALKGITGSLLFAFFSMIFIFIKSIPLNTITGLLLGVLSLILVLLSAATGYYLYILVKKNYPEELLNRKTGVESGLLEIFTNENFPEKNFGTGELYEYLFQYFEDFLSFRDLQNELSVIKKGSGSRISIEEREEKLQSLSDNKENIRQEIEDKLKSLDINIHPVPERENIKNLVSEIDEMIEEILLEEKHKETIAKKIESESKQYKSGEKSQETIDASISEIDSAIEKLKKDITDITFMNKVYNETADQWFIEKLAPLSEKCAGIYSSLINETGKNIKLRNSISELVLNEKKENLTNEEIAAIAFSMKLAIAETAPPAFNYPFILADPLPPFTPEIADKLKKILLELSEKKQVVIITSKNENNLAGNLINI